MADYNSDCDCDIKKENTVNITQIASSTMAMITVCLTFTMIMTVIMTDPP